MALILVVDDQEDILETTSLILRKDGHEVITARNGVLGLECARTREPDLILLDIEMPVMDGWETLRLLRLENETVHIPVAMFTILFDLREQARALKYGAQEYLAKPFEIQDLLKRVRGVIQAARSGLEVAE